MAFYCQFYQFLLYIDASLRIDEKNPIRIIGCNDRWPVVDNSLVMWLASTKSLISKKEYRILNIGRYFMHYKSWKSRILPLFQAWLDTHLPSSSCSLSSLLGSKLPDSGGADNGFQLFLREV